MLEMLCLHFLIKIVGSRFEQEMHVLYMMVSSTCWSCWFSRWVDCVYILSMKIDEHGKQFVEQRFIYKYYAVASPTMAVLGHV